MIKVNLLPKPILDRRKKTPFAVFCALSVGLAILICLFLSLSLKEQMMPLARELDSVEKQSGLYQSKFRNLNMRELEDKEAELKLYREALLDLTNSQPSWPLLLYEISKGLPVGVWLTEINQSVSDETVTIRGNSLNRTMGVIEFMENLSKIPLFRDVSFSNMSKKMVGEVEATEFKLICRLHEAPPGTESE